MRWSWRSRRNGWCFARRLAEADVEVVREEGLTASERAWLADHFREQILPVLTPQAIDPSHPFPFIPNGGFSLVFDLRRGKKAEPVVELLMIPSTLPRFLKLPGKGLRFIAIENVIRAHFDQLFPGFEKAGAGAFRLLRDSDIEVEEDAEDLVRYFRSAIKRRRRGRVIRIEFAADTPPDLEALVRDRRRRRFRAGRGKRRLHRHRRPWPAGRGRSARPQIPALHAALPGADRGV